MQIISTGPCPLCGTEGKVELTDDQYERYQYWKGQRYSGGPFIQDALFDLGAGDREQIMSGTHGKCFDEHFGI